MSDLAPPPRRRRARYAVGVALAVLLLGTGCTGRKAPPTKYGNTTQTNFRRGCLIESRRTGSGISDPEKYCTCAYAKIVDTIPFDRFKEINSDLSHDPGPLPADMLKIRDACVESLG